MFISTIYEEEKADLDPLKLTLRQLQPVGMQFHLPSITQEEAVSKTLPITANYFDHRRAGIVDSLRTLVNYVWQTHSIPQDSPVIEYGAGASGYYARELKPIGVREWVQVEINPTAVAENRRRNPEAIVFEGSYYNIPFDDVKVFTGLSSLDAVTHLNEAIHQISTALSPGGYLIHIQDVLPGLGGVVKYVKDTTGSLPTQGYQIRESDQGKNRPIGLIIDGQRETFTELFRQALGHVITQSSEMELIKNHYITLIEPINGEFDKLHFLDTKVTAKLIGATERRRTIAKKRTTIIATIARKI